MKYRDLPGVRGLPRGSLFIALALFFVLVALAAHAAEPSPPRPITITASPQEVQQLAVMLEQYGRACAAFLPMQNCATVPLAWEQKLQQAADEASKPAPPPPGAQPVPEEPKK